MPELFKERITRFRNPIIVSKRYRPFTKTEK